jgi:hypothetical protein
MSVARTGRRAGAVVLVAGALLAGGCGVHESEVVGAGSPATVEAFGGRESMLFFHAPDGELTPVFLTPESLATFGPEYAPSDLRREDPSSVEAAPMSTEKLVMALLHGPRDEDRAAGLTTSLHPVRPRGTVQVTPTAEGQVTTVLPIALGGLNRTALRQLICTIAYSHARDGRVTVQMRGWDDETRSGTCGLDPDS